MNKFIKSLITIVVIMIILPTISLPLNTYSTIKHSNPRTLTKPTKIKTTRYKPIVGIIKVYSESMLERDIIPQICHVFSLSQNDVKNTLAASQKNKLIGSRLTDFRRMEGMILPGEYKITKGKTLKQEVSEWIASSIKRYNKLLSFNHNLNSLKPTQQLALASVVEAECLSTNHQEETATVFLNRLASKSKLQSCVTAEYVLGYQRPFLTLNDIKKRSLYNTYYVTGLPAGPICTVSDASLQSAMSKKMKSSIYFFYYDYIKNDMFFFSDYTKFQKEAAISMRNFTRKSKVNKYAKINKQKLYGRSSFYCYAIKIFKNFYYSFR